MTDRQALREDAVAPVALAPASAHSRTIEHRNGSAVFHEPGRVAEAFDADDAHLIPDEPAKLPLLIHCQWS